jgi:hypothetical protein
MNNVDVKIYVAQIKTFFNENPDELKKILGKASSEDFFDAVEKVALENYINGDDIPLTQGQLIELIVDLNKFETKKITTTVMAPYTTFKYGKIYLN